MALTGGAGARSTDGNVGALLNLQRAQSTTLLRRTESAIAARNFDSAKDAIDDALSLLETAVGVDP